MGLSTLIGRPIKLNIWKELAIILELHIAPQKIDIKGSKKWARSTRVNMINLNLNLIKCSHDMIDYIILHEFEIRF
jgi:predicted metal-dependent hydrolase